MLHELPRPPLGDFFDYLIERPVAEVHADALLCAGTLKGIDRGELVDILCVTWLLYLQGHSITAVLKEQKSLIRDCRKTGRLLAAELLATQPKARPKQYGDQALIQAMWIIWRKFAPRVRGFAAYDGFKGCARPGKFQRFVLEWLKKIDPEREKPPSRHAFDTAKRRLT